MKQQIQIRCKNNKKTINVEIGSRLLDVFNALNLDMPHGAINCKVNNKIEGLHYRLYHNKDLEFLDMRSPLANRTYTRSMFFVLCKAVHDLYPQSMVRIEIPVSNGYYCNFDLGHTVGLDDVEAIRQRMQQIIDADIPIRRYEVPSDDAIKMFQEKGDDAKVKLIKSTGLLYTTYYKLDDYVDYFYGSLLTSTGSIYLFGLDKYYDGVLLRAPSMSDPEKLGDMIRQDKMFEIFQEHHHWQKILGVSTVGDFNDAIKEGHATDLINISEALQEKKISQIADEIANRKGVKVILIAGPSSSGKTTFCKRLSIQLLTNGIKPMQISLDDYFVDRELTPRDESGDYDFESIYSLNIDLINHQLQALFRGEEVQLPRYDFPSGKSMSNGKKLKLESDQVLIMEGIHALNPMLTSQIPNEQKYKIYISALTTIMLDDHNYIPTTDNRLLRRIIRDNKYRGTSAQETIRRWPSVRNGENKWIFPFQENCDAMFNTAMLFELAVIRQQAEPLLELVPENCDEYTEAHRLRKFIRYIQPINYKVVPPTSLLREFLGGSSFKY